MTAFGEYRIYEKEIVLAVIIGCGLLSTTAQKLQKILVEDRRQTA